MSTIRLSPKQLIMLIDLEDGDATDLDDFNGPGGWHNRESVINALIRKGLLDNDAAITEKGRELLRCPKK